MANKPLWKVRAARQMERDGIRRLSRGEVGRATCKHEIFRDEFASIRCGKPVRYHTPFGNRCFTHAISQCAEQVSA